MINIITSPKNIDDIISIINTGADKEWYTNTKEVTKSELEVKLMKYDKEEEFLIALKQLQRNLTN